MILHLIIFTISKKSLGLIIDHLDELDLFGLNEVNRSCGAPPALDGDHPSVCVIKLNDPDLKSKYLCVHCSEQIKIMSGGNKNGPFYPLVTIIKV